MMGAVLTLSSVDYIDQDSATFGDGATREPTPNAEPKRRFRPASVLNLDTMEAIEADSATPWLLKELQTLAVIAGLETDWESTGAAPPNRTAIRLAARVLSALSELDFQPDHIDPSTDEGVCISFRRANRYADLECFNTGEVLAVISTDGHDPLIWELTPDEIGEATAKIYGFVFG